MKAYENKIFKCQIYVHIYLFVFERKNNGSKIIYTIHTVPHLKPHIRAKDLQLLPITCNDDSLKLVFCYFYCYCYFLLFLGSRQSTRWFTDIRFQYIKVLELQQFCGFKLPNSGWLLNSLTVKFYLGNTQYIYNKNTLTCITTCKYFCQPPCSRHMHTHSQTLKSLRIITNSHTAENICHVTKYALTHAY